MKRQYQKCTIHGITIHVQSLWIYLRRGYKAHCAKLFYQHPKELLNIYTYRGTYSVAILCSLAIKPQSIDQRRPSKSGLRSWQANGVVPSIQPALSAFLIRIFWARTSTITLVERPITAEQVEPRSGIRETKYWCGQYLRFRHLGLTFKATFIEEENRKMLQC